MSFLKYTSISLLIKINISNYIYLMLALLLEYVIIKIQYLLLLVVTPICISLALVLHIVVVYVIWIMIKYILYKIECYLVLFNERHFKYHIRYLVLICLFVISKIFIVYIGVLLFPGFKINYINLHYFVIFNILISPLILCAILSVSYDKDFNLTIGKYIFFVAISLLFVLLIKLFIFIWLSYIPLLYEIFFLGYISYISTLGGGIMYMFETGPLPTAREIEVAAYNGHGIDVRSIRPVRITSFLDHLGNFKFDGNAYMPNPLEPYIINYIESVYPDRSYPFPLEKPKYVIVTTRVQPKYLDQIGRIRMYNSLIDSTFKILFESREVTRAFQRCTTELILARKVLEESTLLHNMVQQDFAITDWYHNSKLDYYRISYIHEKLYNYIQFCQNDIGPLLTNIYKEWQDLTSQEFTYLVDKRKKFLYDAMGQIIIEFNRRGDIISQHRLPGFHISYESYVAYRIRWRLECNANSKLDVENEGILEELVRRHNGYVFPN